MRGKLFHVKLEQLYATLRCGLFRVKHACLGL